MALPLLGNLRAKFSETSFSHFKTFFTQISHCYLFTTIILFKRIDSNNFTLSSMFPFQNVWPVKRKAVYTYSSTCNYYYYEDHWLHAKVQNVLRHFLMIRQTKNIIPQMLNNSLFVKQIYYLF